MLIISRRPQEAIVFPTIGITVRVVRVADKVVRIAVDAPRAVPVFRGELLQSPAPGQAGDALEEAARRARHDLLGRLNAATVGLHLARKQIEKGHPDGADSTLQQALQALEGLEKELTNPTAPQQKGQGRLTALLVEDNPNESALLGGYLRMSGVEVADAADGLEALNYLATHQSPDVVLLDMGLPRCDGPTTVAAIRANKALSSLKVFVVSGRGRDEAPALDGIDAWFSKPLNPARLLEALTEAR